METSIAIKLQNVSIYQRDNLILSNVNINILAGEFVYLVGSVGSGKSSLIKTLNAELPVGDGSVRVLDYNLESIKQKEVPFVRRKLGVVFQDFKLLDDRSVYKNLLFVLKATGWEDKNAIESRIDEILSEVGMQKAKDKMPHQLSGGEQQRIVIARALLNNPEIILADEPTGNLDADTSSEIMELLKKINSEGKTILMATHDQVVISKYPNRTLLCEKQKILDLSENKAQLDFSELVK